MQMKTTQDMTSQDTACEPPAASPSDAEFPSLVEGARYALLQRLAPALQHHLVGQLQPMDMIALMMERRLQAADPDLASIRQDCALLGNVSRTAVKSIIGMMGWIEPRPAATINVNTGVKECMELLVTEFRFNGFVIVNEVTPIDADVACRAFRTLLSASLVAFSDASKMPARLVLRAHAMAQQIKLTIDLHATEEVAKNAPSTSSRSLKWKDGEILAQAESVELTHGSTGVQLVFSYSTVNESTDFLEASVTQSSC